MNKYNSIGKQIDEIMKYKQWWIDVKVWNETKSMIRQIRECCELISVHKVITTKKLTDDDVDWLKTVILLQFHEIKNTISEQEYRAISNWIYELLEEMINEAIKIEDFECAYNIDKLDKLMRKIPKMC